ncbi:MAG: hypothetical protein GY803_07010 [Chloroflexi bacterium]|nr:hypothetical protein [Chloroflexota bacterium]
MLITYLNHVRTRVIGDIVWSKENGHTVEIDDPETVDLCLTHDGFAIAEDEPLLRLMTAEEAWLLAAEAGVATAVALAALNKQAIRKAAEAMDVSVETVSEWVAATKKLPDGPVLEEKVIAEATAVASASAPSEG